MSTFVRGPERAPNRALSIVQSLFREYHPRNFNIRLWDGTQWPSETEAPFTLTFHNPGALRKMLANPTSDLSLAEAYIYGDLDVDGNIEGVFPIADYLLKLHPRFSERLKIGCDLFSLPKTAH